MIAHFIGLLFSALILGGCASASSVNELPDTAWLEEVEGERALAFVRQENERTQKLLEAEPGFTHFRKQLEEILMAKDRIPYGHFMGQGIYNFWQDEKHTRGILRRTTLSGYRRSEVAWKTILDVDQLAAKEKENWVYQGVQCLEPNEQHCLIHLSRGGKDAGVIREFNMKSRGFVQNGFYLPEAKSDASWWDADTLLVGTDWGAGTLTKSGYPRQIRVWKRGEDLHAAKLLFEVKEDDLSADARVFDRPEGKQLLLARNIDFYSQEIHWVRPDLNELRRLPFPLDARVLGFFEGQIIFSTRSNWSVPTEAGSRVVEAGELASFDFDHWLKTGKMASVSTLFKASESQAYVSATWSKSFLSVLYLDNVQSRMLKLQRKDGQWVSEPFKMDPSLNLRVTGASHYHDDVMISAQGYLNPNVLWHWNGKTQKLVKLKQLPHRFNTKGLGVEQLWATSRDGTKIPYFVVGPKGDATPRPTLLTAYGGFEISNTPYYSGGVGRVWLERGGRYVTANIRGGGEFGPRWHQAGLKTKRQLVFDDFFAVAEDLIRRGLTTSQQLGASGASNGGLLMGVAFTQRPDLFAAIDCGVPLLDMLNYHKWLAGNSWMGEYGNPDVPEERKALLAYSPLHNLDPNAKYPEIFFDTSTQDDRVHPAHARKMAYMLKMMGKPFLYYENIEGGHSSAANLKQRAYKAALSFVYTSKKLGLPFTGDK